MRKTTKPMKEIKNLNQQREILYSWVGRFNVAKMAILPNLI